jgi:hypothetical protein
VRHRAAFPFLLILLCLIAVALGCAHVARTQRSSANAQDASALTVKAYGGLARRGFRVYLSFRVQAPGAVTVRLTMRLKTHVAASGTVKRVAPSFETRQVWRSKPIGRAVPAGRYTFCAVASDGAGHHAKNCAAYRVV